MATYYVRTNGDDSSGNGSTGTPWLTVKKALATVAAGDTILVGDGTYAENDSGALLLKRVFASYVTIAPENGTLGAVTITTASGTIGTWVSASAAYYKFQYITFTTVAGAANVLRINSTADHIAFENCTFTPVDNSASTLFISNASTWNVSNISFTDCVFNKPAVGASHNCVSLSFSSTGTSSAFGFTRCTFQSNATCIDLLGADGVTFTSCTMTAGGRGINFTGSPDTVSFINCVVTGGTYGIWANGATNLVITGGSITTTGAFGSALFGVDSNTGGGTTTVVITDVAITHPTGTAGHALLFGNGCLNCVADGISIPRCGDNALVVKENTGTEVKNCNITSGTSAALYFKAAASPNAHDNRIIASQGSGFQLLKGDTGNKNSNWQFLRNKVIVSGTGSHLQIGGDVDDAGGGVSDYNKYSPSSNFGVVRASSGIATLAGIKAAWVGYGDGTNESHSRLAGDDGGELLFLLGR
jgi:hypothetical protein